MLIPPLYHCSLPFHRASSPISIEAMSASTAPESMSSDKVVIIGGGMGGIAMGVQLKRLLNHNNFEIYEKLDDIGGTWAQNRYPNLSCDVPSEVSEPCCSQIFSILTSVSSTHSHSSKIPTGLRNLHHNKRSWTMFTPAPATSISNPTSVYSKNASPFNGPRKICFGLVYSAILFTTKPTK